MDWKKTMNSLNITGEKVDMRYGSNKEAEQFTEENIEQYLTKLLPELNLRLFLEMYSDETEEGEVMTKSLYPMNFLWIEEITVTSYEPGCTERRTFNCLMGKWASKAALALKKYKKERR